MRRLVTNPVIRKELLQRLRERRAWLLPTLYLLVVAGAALFAYHGILEGSEAAADQVQGADIGAAVFFTVIFSQMLVLVVMAPVFSAGALTIEKEQRTLQGLLTSLLTTPQIWWGKFVAALLYLLLLLFSALPLLVLSFAFGGVEPLQLVKAMTATVLVLACIATFGLWCSSLFRRSIHSTATAYGMVLVLSVVTVIAYGILSSYAEPLYASGRAAYLQLPLFLNPAYPLLGLLEVNESVFSYPFSSCLLYIGLACLAAALAMRRIQRSGEQL
jgi:ABC-2 type transport system permease protein